MNGSLLTQSWVQATRLLTRLRRDTAVLMGSLMLPICLLLVYKVVLGEQVHRVTGVDSLYGVVPICALLSALFGALGGSVGIHTDRESRLLSRMWVLPVHRASALIGFFIAEALRALFGTILITSLGVFLGLRFAHGWLAVVVYLLIPSIMVIGYSALVLAIAIRSNGRGIMNWLVGATITLAFVNPGTTPIKQFPDWLQPIVRAQPMSPPIEAMWALSYGGPLLWPLVVTLIWATVLFAVFTPIAMRGYQIAAESNG
ncbi:MAG: ABC transporter permease [Mycobacterium sp.]|nr:ABC transporter permease [Mycobacterium sp.]MCB0940273.1 ABC transporter permease [Mycobacterium sp.]